MIKLLFSKKNSNWDLICVSLILAFAVTQHFWIALLILVFGIVISVEGEGHLQIKETEERIEQDRQADEATKKVEALVDEGWQYLARNGYKSKAITLYRDIYGSRLVEAKDVVEAYLQKNHEEGPWT